MGLSARRLHAFRSDDVDDLLAAAAAAPPSNVRSAWPVRDVAIVDVLARCGPRLASRSAASDASVGKVVAGPYTAVRSCAVLTSGDLAIGPAHADGETLHDHVA